MFLVLLNGYLLLLKLELADKDELVFPSKTRCMHVYITYYPKSLCLFSIPVALTCNPAKNRDPTSVFKKTMIFLTGFHVFKKKKKH